MQVELLKEIEGLRTKLSELESKVKEVKPQFEVGKWYKSTVSLALVFLNAEPKDNTNIGFGFNGVGIWVDKWHYYKHVNLVPATKEEVEPMLIKEAERKYNYETVIKTIRPCTELDYKNVGLIGKPNNHIDFPIGTMYGYCAKTDTLFNWGFGAHIVYEKGVWAEAIKDSPIKIGGYEVRYNAGNGGTTIDGHNFTKEFWQAAKIVAQHPKAKIKIGCSHQFDLTLKVINSILDKLK